MTIRNMLLSAALVYGLFSTLPVLVFGNRKTSDKPSLLFPFEEDGRWGYIDSTGNIIIQPRFDDASEFSEGLATVQLDGRHLIYENGRLTKLPRLPVLRFVGTFSEGRACVQALREGGPFRSIEKMGPDRYRVEPAFEGGKWGYIDNKGQIIVEPKFGWARGFSEGLAAVNIGGRPDLFVPKGGKWGYINKAGELVIEPKFGKAGDFSEGLAAVELGGRWGFIDRTGKLVIRTEYEEALFFSDGLAPLRTKQKWGFVNVAGELVIAAKFGSAHSFSQGFAAINIGGTLNGISGLRGGKWGYINKDGEVVIETQFEYAGDFSEGLAAVELGGKWGFINQKGQIAIEPTFITVDAFLSGIARVQFRETSPSELSLHSGWGYINISGEYVWRTRKQQTWWTCSMHPEIRRLKPGKCPICYMDLILVSSSGGDIGH